MTKIASKKPESQARPVYVTDSQYEIWYSKPQSLGTIDNRGGYWFTADNRRFASSRDAMSYLVHIMELTGNPPAVVFGRMDQEKLAKSISKAHAIVKEEPIATSTGEKASYTKSPTSREDGRVQPSTPARAVSKPVPKQVGPSRSGAETINTEINQNHPMFQQFMDFVDFQARRKMTRLDKPTE